jgi:hypothetical protein
VLRDGGGGRSADSPERAAGEPSAPGLAPAPKAPSDARSVDLVLVYPGRARLPSSVLVALSQGARERASFLLEVEEDGAKAISVESEARGFAVSSARVEADGARVLVRLDHVPAGADVVSARTVDRREPALTAGSERIPDGRAPSVTLALDVADARGWLAVRAVREGERVEDVSVEVRRGTETLARVRTGDERTPAVPVPPDEPLLLVVVGYDGSSVLGLPPPLEVRAPSRRIVDVAVDLPPGRRVRVVAKDRHGESTPFALSLWRETPDGRRAFVPLRGLLAAEPELRAWHGRLAPGAYVAVVDPRAHHAPGSLRFDVTAPRDPAESPAPEAVVEVPVGEDGVRTRFRLTKADGRPLARALVNVNRETDLIESLAAHAATTDADGEFVTPPLPPGAYVLHVWSERLATRLRLGDGVAVERVLPPPCLEGCASLSGVVLDADGRGARWPRVLLHRDDGWSHVSSVDASGAYSFPRVLPGTYALEVVTTPYSEISYAPLRTSVTLSPSPSILDVTVTK